MCEYDRTFHILATGGEAHRGTLSMILLYDPVIQWSDPSISSKDCDDV